ncbi:MAG: hypothetical protein J6W74_03365 [Bacteroidales bacterium]|nr:hypothetical protein [Bacteroidales bacterium]
MSAKKKGGFIRSLFTGEILMSMKADKYFVHIIYTFFLILGCLLLGYRIEQTFVKAERNKATIDELKIRNAELIYKVEQQHRMTKLLDELNEEGSDVSLPTEPPVILKK